MPPDCFLICKCCGCYATFHLQFASLLRLHLLHLLSHNYPLNSYTLSLLVCILKNMLPTVHMTLNFGS